MGMPSASASASISKEDSLIAALATGTTFAQNSRTMYRAAIVAANAFLKALDCVQYSMGSFVVFEVVRKN